MSSCDNCFFGGKKVPYKGNPESPFVVVGESPGIMELAKGIPFIGDSGKVLHDTLDLLGCTVEPFVTNAIQCFPRMKDPTKLASACRACNSRLLQEVRAYPRKVILTLGNAALWSLTGDYNKKITKERGKIFKSDLAEHGIVAAVHPAFLLRGGGNMDQFRRDISVALGFVQDMNIPAASAKMQLARTFQPGTYTVIETTSHLDWLVRELWGIPAVGIDTETSHLDPRKGKILCAGISWGKDNTFVIPAELLTDALFNDTTQYTWHNGKFDIHWWRHHGFTKARVDDDTMLLSYMLNEKGGIHDLEQVGSDWLSAPNYKNMLEEYLPNKKTSYEVIPKPVLYKYQAIDSQLTYELREPLRAKVIPDIRLGRVYTDIVIPANEFLYAVESNGFAVDVEMCKKNEEELLAQAGKHEMEFCSMAKEALGVDLNIRSPQQVARYIYGFLKLAREGTSTDANTLEILPKHPAVEALKKYRKVHKQVSTFVTPVLARMGDDGRMRTTFKLHGTTTGRLSSNKPNMQNIPRDPKIRGQFYAPPGRAILEVDLSQAELRVLACASKCPALIEIFLSGKSLHDEVAEYLFGKGFNKEQKMIAKNINFGIVYGITADGLMDQIEVGAARQGSNMHVTRQEAQAWINGWAARFPTAWEFIQKCRGAVVRGDTLVSLFGRKRRFPLASREMLSAMQNEAANFPEQSAAHDITLLTGIELHKPLKDKYDCLIVNEVHDALINEVPDNLLLISKIAIDIIKTMERIPRDWGITQVPFKAEAEVGYRWGNCKSFQPHKIIELADKGELHATTVREYLEN